MSHDSSKVIPLIVKKAVKHKSAEIFCSSPYIGLCNCTYDAPRTASNFQSALAKARPNDSHPSLLPPVYEERRQVRIVIGIGIYPSMDQPPMDSRRKGGPLARGDEHRARIRVHRCARFTGRRCNRRCNRHPMRVVSCTYNGLSNAEHVLGDRILMLREFRR